MTLLTFRIQHGEFAATLGLSGEHTLHDLAETILEAVGFECDRAFGFYGDLKNPYRSKECYTLFADMGEEDDNPGVKNTSVGSVFMVGKKMTFLFDYGEDRRFPVTCVEAEDLAKKLLKPKVLSTEGKPPVQYPDFDEKE